MDSVPRRRVLGGIAASLGGLLMPARARASACPALVADPSGWLDLPAGFSYTILETAGGLMDDGFLVPGKPDGMALFTLQDGTLCLMRNHELPPGSHAGPYAAGAAPPEAFDPLSMGAVTRLVLDPITYARISSNLVLCGTNRMCSGGGGSWGWIATEEDVAPGHGFAFACDPEATSVQPPVKLDFLGRFNHEAAALDEATQDVYLTEDRKDGCLYRSTTVNGSRVLQAMTVVGMPAFDTGTMLAGDVVAVDWVALAQPTPNKDNLRYHAAFLGAAVVHRGEGIHGSGPAFAISATAGGPIGRGQIFLLDAAASTLECLACSTDPLVLDMPDTIALSPWGQVFIGEDGPGTDCLRALTSAGDFCDVGFQASGTSEIAGLAFSAAGDALFCNLQEDGLTIVIQGPFQATFDL